MGVLINNVPYGIVESVTEYTQCSIEPVYAIGTNAPVVFCKGRNTYTLTLRRLLPAVDELPERDLKSMSDFTVTLQTDKQTLLYLHCELLSSKISTEAGKCRVEELKLAAAVRGILA